MKGGSSPGCETNLAGHEPILLAACSTDAKQRSVFPEPSPVGIEVRTHRFHELPKPAAVIGVAKMAQLVNHHIIENARRSQHEAPVKGDRSQGGARSPTGLLVSDEDPLRFDPNELGEGLDSAEEDLLGLGPEGFPKNVRQNRLCVSRQVDEKVVPVPFDGRLGAGAIPHPERDGASSVDDGPTRAKRRGRARYAVFPFGKVFKHPLAMATEVISGINRPAPAGEDQNEALVVVDLDPYALGPRVSANGEVHTSTTHHHVASFSWGTGFLGHGHLASH